MADTSPNANHPPDPPKAALDWVIDQRRSPNEDNRLKEDWSASLNWEMDQLGASLARDRLNDLLHARVIEARDPCEPTAPWCNPLDAEAPYDFERFVVNGRASVTPPEHPDQPTLEGWRPPSFSTVAPPSTPP